MLEKVGANSPYVSKEKWNIKNKQKSSYVGWYHTLLIFLLLCSSFSNSCIALRYCYVSVSQNMLHSKKKSDQIHNMCQ